MNPSHMAQLARKACFSWVARSSLLAGSKSSRELPVLVCPRALMATGPSHCPTAVPKIVETATQVGIVPDNKRYRRLMTIQSHFCACFPLVARSSLLAGSKSSGVLPVLVCPRASMASGPSQCPTPVPKIVHHATKFGIVPDNKRYKKLMTIQTRFCRPDGIPVWQKMGQRDKIMYQFTLLFVLFGVLSSGYTLGCWIRK